MPVYEYQGKHYELSETDPSAAKQKILSHLNNEKSSSGEAFGKSLVEGLPEAGGGLAGAEAGAMGGAALGAMTGPFAPVAVPVLGLAGGVAGGLGGGYAGEKIGEYVGQQVPESVKEKLGFSAQQRAKESSEHPIASVAGKYAPDIAALSKLGYDVTKLGIKSAKDLANSLLGKDTRKAQEELVKASQEASQTGQKSISAQTEAEKAASESAKKSAQEEARKAQIKQEQAIEAEKKAAGQGRRSLRDLVGFKTKLEAGEFKPVSPTLTDIGKYIRTQSENFVKSIKDARDLAAKKNFSDALVDATLKQQQGLFVNTDKLVSKIDNLLEKGGSTDYLNSLTTLKNDLARTKDFEGLEVIRRRLGDAGFGLPEEGYKAIGQNFSKDMYKDLSNQMKEYSPAFEKYLDDYKRLSKNLEVYGTKVGRGIKDTQDSAGKYYSKTAEQVTKDIFSSPEKFQQFVDAVGGNKEIATATARRYFSGLAENAKSSEKVSELIKNNRALLQGIKEATGVDIASELTSKYLSKLAQSERRVTEAGKIAEETKTTLSDLDKRAKDIDKNLGTKLKNIESGKTMFTDTMNTLSSAEPGKAVDKFDTVVLPKIREAEQKAGTKIINEEQIAALRNQVHELDRIADATRRKIVAAQIAAGLFGVGAAYETGKKVLNVVGGQ